MKSPRPTHAKAPRLLCAALTLTLSSVYVSAETSKASTGRLQRLKYNNPGLVVDVGVGLWGWPLPMDYNHDGLIDLVLSSTDNINPGIYYFENTGQVDPQDKLPIFAAARQIGETPRAPQISYVNGKAILTSPGAIYRDFGQNVFANPAKLPAPERIHPLPKEKSARGWPDGVRDSHWRMVDYDGDGVTDLIVGIDYWADYKWEKGNAGPEPSYTPEGKWIYGPLHGYVYLLRNKGTDDAPDYEKPVMLEAGGAPIDVYGEPSPSFADFRHTGKLDLICGDFLGTFTFFENIGTRTQPRYAAGKQLKVGGQPLQMDLCMITPTVIDFNGDGFPDLISGDEDGRAALIENTGGGDGGAPQFYQPRYFKQIADEIKVGALATPVSVDWDNDGLSDLIVGDSAGHLAFIKNLGGTPNRWAAPRFLEAGGRLIRLIAGYNGAVQGPSEGRWGYSNPSVIDWDGDGLLDIICNDIWGRVEWYKNVGSKEVPKLAAAQPLQVSWPGEPAKPYWVWWKPENNQLVAQWRTTPFAIDFNNDGLADLVMMDHEGYLAFFERKKDASGKLTLLPGKRIFRGETISSYDANGAPLNHEAGLLQLNGKLLGAAGRRNFCMVDWDGDGRLDLLVNSVPNVNFLKNVGDSPEGGFTFRDMGPVDTRKLAGHATAPTVVYQDKDGIPDLLVGAEDGFIYAMRNPRH